MKILIADQSKTMRTIVRRTLRQAGLGRHEIHEADTADRALERLLHHAPQLVLSDSLLPGMDGLQFLAKVRELRTRTVFGFVTSTATVSFRRLARDAGAHFVIGKPFTTDVFEHLLSPLLLNGEAEVPQQLAPVSLQATLMTLCGKPCRVESLPYWNGQDAAVAALYTDADAKPAGALFADAGFACALAAATNLADPAVAHHGLRKNMVPHQLRDCVRELVNILGGILNQERREHLVLSQVWLDAELPASVEDLVGRACRVATHDVRVEGYAYGRVTLANNLSV